jgi:hypothetical protein
MMTIASADTPAPIRERRTTPAIGMIFQFPGGGGCTSPDYSQTEQISHRI